ncbi:MAG: hypothetical protein KGI93_08120 [Acidobacteriota bacterium]|nr:hypothetical protein [Acidobacteriota bacterium]MDE3189770.1 hypothetical protein [Acidobacteriota bacterium]
MAEEHDPLKVIEGAWRGRSKTDLQDAIKDSWEQAKAAGAQPGNFQVTGIYFNAENPITEYSVTIGHI